MKINGLIRILLLLILLYMPSALCLAGSGISSSIVMPYYLGKSRDYVVPGEIVQAFFELENTGLTKENISVLIELPHEFLLTGQYENWQVIKKQDKTILKATVLLSEGYGHWFDYISFKVAADIQAGTYTAKYVVNGNLKEIPINVAVGQTGPQALSLAKIVLPLDKDGKKDERLNENTLVLRDRKLDYYKNVLLGKGASNQEIEAVHPVTHMGVDFYNPGSEQKLVTITTRLLDKNTHRPVSGLYTPGTTGEDKDAGSMEGHNDCLVAFAALTGEKKQRINIPVYADERFVAGGDYFVQVTVEDGISQPIVTEIPLRIIKKNMQAMVTVIIAVIILSAALVFAVTRMRRALVFFKTRWLITIALFGTSAFALVNIPSTLLNDFFHILLGPFGFLITGLFNGIFLYMLIAALVILIPQPGVVALMTAVRMLLGMLAFGHVSPVSFLSYGLHALLLEAMLLGLSFYSTYALQIVKNISFRHVLMTAIICGLADSVATYVTMQAMAFLYRLYFADWYIYMIMAVNGFLYTAIGAGCGVFLGRQLLKVGGD